MTTEASIKLRDCKQEVEQKETTMTHSSTSVFPLRGYFHQPSSISGSSVNKRDCWIFFIHLSIVASGCCVSKMPTVVRTRLCLVS